MNKIFGTLGFYGLLSVIALSTANVRAQDALDRVFEGGLFEACMNNVKPECQSWALRGGGSEVPRGMTSDSKVDLAMGETYILTGVVVIAGSNPYLRIDFRAHPWLANGVRLRNPFYRLNDSIVNWRKLEGKPATVVASARYSAWSDSSGRTFFEIYLQPASQSIIEGLQPSSPRR